MPWLVPFAYLSIATTAANYTNSNILSILAMSKVSLAHRFHSRGQSTTRNVFGAVPLDIPIPYSKSLDSFS
jgi:hypothetical protein